MDSFTTKFDHIFSELQISKTCNSLLRKQIIDLGRSSLDNSQCLRSPQFRWRYHELEGLVCKALSLTGNEVSPNDLEARHHLKKNAIVIVKFKS